MLRKHKYLSFATGSRLVYKAPRGIFEVSRASGGKSFKVMDVHSSSEEDDITSSAYRRKKRVKHLPQRTQVNI